MILPACIRNAFALSNETYGSPRMTVDLQEEGFAVGRRRVARLMRLNGLQARRKRRFKRTTDSHHAWPVTANLPDRDFAAVAPDRKWTVHISYVWTADGWLYPAIVMDLYSRRIVGWSTSDRLKRQIAFIDRERSLPVERIGDENVDAFRKAVRSALRSTDNPAFARAYIGTIVSDVIVTEDEVTVRGPSAALMAQTAAFAERGELAPSFAQEWRATLDEDDDYVYAIAL